MYCQECHEFHELRRDCPYYDPPSPTARAMQLTHAQEVSLGENSRLEDALHSLLCVRMERDAY